MAEPDLSKSTTRQILIVEPDEELLKKQLVGRDVSPELRQFLKRLMAGKKWPRKINIPSTHDNLAAALVFSTELKEGGLEIFSELHVFFEGSTLVEKWPVAGEKDSKSDLPKETFTSIEIEKVRLDNGRLVQVTIAIPLPGGTKKTIIRIFDFNDSETPVRIIPHPLL